MKAENRKDGTGRSNGSNGIGGHSADVRIRLRVGEESFEVSQVGDGRLTFFHPVTIRGNHGEVWLAIDGSELHWPVVLHGITVDSGPSAVVGVAFGNLKVGNGHGRSL